MRIANLRKKENEANDIKTKNNNKNDDSQYVDDANNEKIEIQEEDPQL